VTKPDWLFLDEATSAIDEDQEAMLYRALTACLCPARRCQYRSPPLADRLSSTGDRHRAPAGSAGRLVEALAARRTDLMLMWAYAIDEERVHGVAGVPASIEMT